MKYFFPALFSFLIYSSCYSQNKNYSFYQLYQLDSIGKSSSFTRHFGALYFDFLQSVEQELETADTTTKRLVRHFETVFAQFYIAACVTYKTGQPISLPAWRSYFKDSTLDPEQYNLLGTNAHLNGGLAQAIANSYTPGEWKQLKISYGLFNKCLNQTYRRVYKGTIHADQGAKLLSILTLGLTKPIGNYYLYKWRKRQMRLTEYYFAGSSKYKLLSEKILLKKEKIDRIIISLL